ncbi:MAG: glycosyltransferase family 4 protein [Bacteroidia bacterium]|nr:glycosyltransferase family 4 protein [Bacteroidia bacterium]
MKIGIEAQRIFRSHKHGMDVVVLELIKQIQTLDKVNEYVVFVKNGPDDQCLKETENVKIQIVGGLSYPDWEQVSLPREVKKSGIDLLHMTSNTAPVRKTLPTLITLHDIIYLERVSFSGTAYQNFGNLYRRWNVPRVVKKADRIITVSNFEKHNILRRMPELEGKLDVVLNGVSPIFRRFSPSDLELRFVQSSYNLPDEFIFFLGNMAPKKNMKGVLKAYAGYLSKAGQTLPLVMAETNETELKGVLKELDLLEIEDKIQLMGYVPQKFLPAMYASCKIFLYPSLRESFGMPIVEAMACGAPVITSDTSSMPEVAGGAALLVDPFKPKEIQAALEKVLANEGLRVDLINKGLENAGRFSWTLHAEKVIQLYKAILGEKVPSTMT